MRKGAGSSHEVRYNYGNILYPILGALHNIPMSAADGAGVVMVSDGLQRRARGAVGSARLGNCNCRSHMTDAWNEPRTSTSTTSRGSRVRTASSFLNTSRRVFRPLSTPSPTTTHHGRFKARRSRGDSLVQLDPVHDGKGPWPPIPTRANTERGF